MHTDDAESAEALRSANSAFRAGEVARAIDLYSRLIVCDPALRPHLSFNLSLARRRYRLGRRGEPPRVAVCGWELSHNAAGRVRAMADIYAGLAPTEMIGTVFEKRGRDIWAPIRGGDMPCHFFRVSDHRAFPAEALAFVRAHPYDVVHLSKPRFPNILIGLLYKLLWDARVLLDIDDEELAINRADGVLELEKMPARADGRPRFENIAGRDWTRISVGLWTLFDGVTVSNAALQKRYGGDILPHARSAAAFAPSPERKARSRARFGVPDDTTVVLFFGTARRHKGLVETARRLAQLGRPDVWFVIAGDVPDPTLKEELRAVCGIRLHFLDPQPYDDIADVVAMGDICILLNDGSEVARFQVPAKLTDALAMGLLTFVHPTEALQDIIDAGAVVPVRPETLVDTLQRYLAMPDMAASIRVAGRRHFLDRLSTEAGSALLRRIALAPAPVPTHGPPGELPDRRQREVFARLGGWEAFKAPAVPAAQPAAVARRPDDIAVGPRPAADDRRIVVYSVLTAGYEAVKAPSASDPAARYILFTDDPDLRSGTWEVRRFDTNGLDPRRASRLPKLLPHRYLPDHDVSVYLDASLRIVAPDIGAVVRDSLQDFDLAAYPHFQRTCIFDEIDECIRLGKAAPDAARALARRLERERFPRRLGLLENAFLVRRDTPVMRRVNELWFDEYLSGPPRDQFYLMYVLWRARVPYATIGDSDNFRKSPHVRFTSHHRQRPKEPEEPSAREAGPSGL